VTAGPAKPRILTWKGNSTNAPETPPNDVKREMAKATRNGMREILANLKQERTFESQPFEFLQ
jgi:hypothetical protein